MENKCKFGNVKKIKDGNIIAKNIKTNSIFFGEPHAPIDENIANQASRKPRLEGNTNLLPIFINSKQGRMPERNPSRPRDHKDNY